MISKIGAIQLCSGLDPEKNLKKIESFLEEAKDHSVDAVFLPEVFYSISDGHGVTPYFIDQVDHNYKAIQNLAKKFQIYLLGGSATTKVDDRFYNRSYNFDPKGDDLGHYDKINIFACDIEKDGKRVRLDEGRIYSAGKDLKTIQADNLKIGLSICFDLRFSNIYYEYAKQEVDLISISSAFTVPSGRAHWHTLVRARAIETQSFVVAANQWGQHNSVVSTYGHSLIVDPWGEILADAGEGEKLIYSTIDTAKIDQVRRSIILRR